MGFKSRLKQKHNELTGGRPDVFWKTMADPRTTVNSTKKVFSKEGMGSYQGAKAVTKGLYAGAIEPVLELGARTILDPTKSNPTQEKVIKALRKPMQVDPKANQTQQALQKGFTFAGAMAPYGAVEGKFIQGVSKIPQVSKYLQSGTTGAKVAPFLIRRAADITSGQILARPDEVGGAKGRLTQAASDVALGTLAEGAGALTKPVIKAAGNKMKTTQIAQKMDAPIPEKYNYHIQDGEYVGNRYQPNVKTQQIPVQEFEAEITGQKIPVSRYNEKGMVTKLLDPETGEMISWSTDNPAFAKRIQEGKLQFGLSTREVKPSETPNQATTPQSGTAQEAQGKKLPLKQTTKNQTDPRIAQSESSKPYTQPQSVQEPQTATSGSKQFSQNQQTFDNNIPQNKRSFKETVRSSTVTSPELAEKVTSDFYNVRNTKELVIKARNFVNDYPDLSRDIAYSAKHDDHSAAIALELIKKYQSEGQIDAALDLVDDFTPKLTEVGRTAQIVSAYNNLTPDGILRFTQREINKAIQLRPDLKGKIKLTGEKSTKILDMAAKLQNMPEGQAKLVETKKLLKEIYEIIPPTLTQKIATFQTIAQLLNPKTAIRNLGGNMGFAGLENVSQTIATPVDALMSLFTGKRTVTLPSYTTQGKGFIKGGIEGTKEVLDGINTTGASGQFDLPKVPVFRNKILAAAEKAMGIELRAADRAFYTAAFDDSLKGQMKLAKTKTATPEMMEIAHLDGLYRTFQDQTTLTQVFTGLKKVLNNIGVKQGDDRFGLGDFILKYPKTPASIISKGIDYSPGGLAKAVIELGKGLTGNGFNQRNFVQSLARGTTGTAGLVGLGAFMGGLGIITEAPNKDKDVRGIQKTVGLGAYQINLSALKRFAFSWDKDAAKIRKGDMLVSYDWAQPMAISLTMGAKMSTDKSVGGVTKSGIESLNAGVETLAEQPLVSGIRDIAQGNKPIGDVIVDTAKKAPASFIPTAVNQFGQLTDNTSRMTYDPNPYNESINMVKGRVPIVRESLPEKTDVFGKPVETYQNGSNNWFNVFLNPAFISKYNPSPEAEEVLRLMDTTGETSQIPRVQNYKVKVNGENVELSPDQINDMQQYIGSRTQDMLRNITNDQAYQAMSDEDKANKITSILGDISTAAKVELLGHKLTKKDSGVQAAMKGSYKIAGNGSLGKMKFKGSTSRGGTGKIKIKVTKASQPKLSVKTPKIKKIKVAKSKVLKVKRA